MWYKGFAAVKLIFTKLHSVNVTFSKKPHQPVLFDLEAHINNVNII